MTLIQAYAIFGLPALAIAVGLLALWAARRGALRVEKADREYLATISRRRQQLNDTATVAEAGIERRVARERAAYGRL